MRMSRLLVRTLREAPADAEVASHQLLVRGGFIRRLASGVYTFLPLGLRVLHNIEAVIREELDAAGCQELLLPALHPLELWEQSGRAALFGSDALPAMQVEARGGSFVLGPTHEEVVTVTVGAEVDSYRQLPLTVYQIQVKFRDEARPRFGLLRTRELIMATPTPSTSTRRPCRPRTAPSTTPTCGSSPGWASTCPRWRPSPAPSAATSTTSSWSPRRWGRTTSSAARPAATRPTWRRPPGAASATRSTRDPDAAGAGRAPHARTARASTRWSPSSTTPPSPPADLLKSLAVVDADGRPVLAPAARRPRGPAARWLAAVRGRRLRRPPVPGQGVHRADGPAGRRASPWWPTSAWPGPGPWITGANRADHHVSGVLLGRDFTVDEWGSFAEVVTGDACPRCGSRGRPGPLGRGRPHVPAGHQVLERDARRLVRGRGRRRGDLLDGLLRHGGLPTAGGGGRGAPRRPGPGVAGRPWPPSRSTWPPWAPAGPPRWPRPPTPSTTAWWRPGSRSSTTTGTCRRGSSSPTPTCSGSRSAWWSGPRAWPGASSSGGPGPPARSARSPLDATRWRRCWAPDRALGAPGRRSAAPRRTGRAARTDLVRVPRGRPALLYFSLCRSVGV